MMINGFVIGKQSVIHVEGEKPELGYTLYDKTAIFKTWDAASDVLNEVGLPLGWVVISLRDLFI